MFVGREQELEKLNIMYESEQFEFAVIYGRRRVGKTTLIKEFCKGKKAIYFIAREANDLINIENFSSDVFAVTSKESEGNVNFNNWEKAFEEICIQYLLKENAKLSLPFVFAKIGRWWGNNPYKKRQEEIDILAVDDENAVFGECKWKNEPTGIGVLNNLIEKSELFKQYKDKYYILFSKSCFTNELEEVAERMGNVWLVDLKKLYWEV